jgi:amino acid adenylation domain-containing protein
MTQLARVIARHSAQDLFPLSFEQRRLWFLQQLEPDNPGYNHLIPLWFSGSLHVAALQDSLNEIIRRQQVLRTSFSLADKQLAQHIMPPLALPLTTLNLRVCEKAERDIQVQRLALQEVRRPFNLAHDLPMRAYLLDFDEEEHILLLTLHRIIYDQQSIDILLRELAVLYHAYANGHLSPLPDLPVQYGDFAIWQEQQFQGAPLEEHLAYWQRHLKDLSTILQFPTDRQRPTLRTWQGARLARLLPRELMEQVEALAQREKVTTFMVLLAAFQVLLLRYTGQEDLVVGTPVTNRTQPELANLIGLFDSLLPVRADMSDNPTFQQLLQRVREVVLGVYKHRDVPLEKLVEIVQPERKLVYNPLFQVTFTYHAAALTPPALSDLEVKLLDFDRCMSIFDLELVCTTTERGLLCSVEYSTDLFGEATIDRMLEHLQVLLEGIVAHPELCLAELPLLTERERRQLLIEWNTSAVDYPRELCVQQLFEEQVQRTPEAVAVIYGDERLTYRELNRRANQLAHRLRALGVGPEARVGICVRRSPEMIVGLLGILKAGGIYVPLDPSYPAERLSFILQDAQVLVLLTQQKLLAQLPAHGSPVLCLDSEWDSIAQQSEANLPPLARGENGAYIIYTSGSTGQPKGVVVQNRSLANLCHWYKRSSHITDASVVLLMIPCGVDASIKNMITSLMAGGQLVLAPDGYYDAAELLRIIEENKVTVTNSAPSLFYTIVDAAKMDDYSNLASLEHLLLGGDVLVLSRLRPWLKSVHCHCTVANIYGPTECTDISASYTIEKADIDLLETVPIGRPVDNVRLYVLDKDRNLQPVGLVGELHIAGDCLARGYLNKPELTAEKFVSDPFVPGAKMYRTGDRVRWLASGNLEFLGRIDHQVKVRGIRIELGEIEAALNRHASVSEAAVLTREELSGERRLVAYIVPRPGEHLTGSILRNYLKERLPEHMLPSIFIWLESLPHTASSKVDRQALPVPQRTRPELEEAFMPPRTTVEKVLASIWAEVLGLEQVGVNDNFFSVGGDSILSMRVVNRARQAGLQLTMKQFFQYQTIAQLASVI